MANRLPAGQKTPARVQPEISGSARQLEDMPMKHYVYPIPRCREGEEDFGCIRELLEGQNRLLEQILSVLDKKAEEKGT